MISQDLSLGNSCSQSVLDNLKEYVVDAARNGTAAHKVEGEVFRKLSKVGVGFLSTHVDQIDQV